MDGKECEYEYYSDEDAGVSSKDMDYCDSETDSDWDARPSWRVQVKGNENDDEVRALTTRIRFTDTYFIRHCRTLGWKVIAQWFILMKVQAQANAWSLKV